MRFSSPQSFIDLVPLHGDDWYKNQLHAGKCVAECLSLASDLVKNKPGISLKYIERACEEVISKMGCTPTFKGYKGFPGAICTSVNKNVVHGIPTSYTLKEGDVVSVDLGATYNGAIADSAITAICGMPKDITHSDLLHSVYKALYAGIEAIKVGEPVGVIGNAIFNYSKKNPYALITSYGGHGITWNTPHCSPFVSNKSKSDQGVLLRPGMALAIEPMLVLGYSDKTKVLKDQWTVAAQNVGVHAEHSVFIHENAVEIMTWRDDDSISRIVEF